MANYRQSAVSGESWERACRVVVEHPYGGSPSANFVKECVVNLGDMTVQQPAGNVYVAFDPAAEIVLVNPVDGAPINQTVTHEFLHTIMHSLFIQEAKKQDEREAAMQNQGAI